MESRKPVNTNDNPVISSNGHNASFGRLLVSTSVLFSLISSIQHRILLAKMILLR